MAPIKSRFNEYNSHCLIGFPACTVPTENTIVFCFVNNVKLNMAIFLFKVQYYIEITMRNLHNSCISTYRIECLV